MTTAAHLIAAPVRDNDPDALFITLIGHHNRFSAKTKVLVTLRIGEVIPPDFRPTAVVSIGATFMESVLGAGDLDSPILDLAVPS